MSYQSVSSPRFYINIVEWLAVINKWNIEDAIRTLPVSQNLSADVDFPTQIQSILHGYSGFPKNPYIALLGHNANDFEVRDWVMPTGNNIWEEDIVNATNPCDKGFSIFKVGDEPPRNMNASNNDGTTVIVGSALYGSYYDMPAPNLSLTMSREYGSTKEFTTHNGSSVSNTMWTKQPLWGNGLGAWELGDGIINQALARSGRRTWQLKFSYMDSSDVFGSNQSLSTYLEDSTGLDGDDVTSDAFTYNLLTDDNFFSQVWHVTLGGTLPFIFQPDNGNFNLDGFAICRFKENSLKATQTAFNVYDISLSIEEAW